MSQYSALKKVSSSLKTLIAATIALVVIFPVAWIILTSLKDPQMMFRIPATIFPENIYIGNYFSVMRMSKFLRYFLNSVIITFFASMLNLTIATLAAFSCSRFKFKGKNIFLACVILTQIMPAATMLIPIYKMWVDLSMINTYSALIITQSVILIPLALWMLVGFFQSIPKEIDEAAIIDGCSPLMVLYYILLRLARPAILASAIYVSMNVWQEFMISMTLTTSDSMRPLMVGLYSFIGERTTNWGPLMAAAVLTTIPIICFVGFTQNQFTHGLGGAVKG